jgi:hypothetical protein
MSDTTRDEMIEQVANVLYKNWSAEDDTARDMFFRLARALADAGLLAYSKAEVPSPDDVHAVERIAKAIGGVTDDEQWELLPLDVILLQREFARRALRALGKAGTDGT